MRERGGMLLSYVGIRARHSARRPNALRAGCGNLGHPSLRGGAFAPHRHGTPRLRIAFASDHAAVALKTLLVAHAASLGHQTIDLGPNSDARVDYPDFGARLAQAVAAGDADRGVALCGSGIGISIAVNRN